MTISATYSAEDNKIRLYASDRLDAETFDRVKAAGFKWAPRQELFVAPRWTPAREDLAIDLAGDIEPEGVTLAERAQSKAERLDELAAKRAGDAIGFGRAARDISERFAMGQPILIGHHSERKARKDQDRMNAAQTKAVNAADQSSHYLYRAESVERHANRKNDPRVRARRIKTLLTELRDLQRTINAAHRSLATWEVMKSKEQIVAFLNYSQLAQAPFGMWSDVNDGTMEAEEARAKCMAGALRTIGSAHLARWIAHTLNRLAFERSLLGDVPRYSGEITPTLLQMFVREHGAEKPQGSKIDDDLFTIEAKAPLPAHIADGDSLELSGDEWRDLMQACGYVPPAKAPGKPPILNLEAPGDDLAMKTRATYRGAHPIEYLPRAAMTKAEWAKIGTEYKGTRLSECGGFRVRVTMNPDHPGPRYQAGWAAIFISDQKAHPAPESITSQEAAA